MSNIKKYQGVYKVHQVYLVGINESGYQGVCQKVCQRVLSRGYKVSISNNGSKYQWIEVSMDKYKGSVQDVSRGFIKQGCSMLKSCIPSCVRIVVASNFQVEVTTNERKIQSII